MANGWAPDGAVQDQIEDSIKDNLAEARTRWPTGESLKYCEVCGDDIPQRRPVALPGVRTCINCQGERDRSPAPVHGSINRRGSKDSKLR